MKKWLRRILWSIGILFLLINAVAFMHAWKFTHFGSAAETRTTHDLSFIQKIMIVLTGVNNPRPSLRSQPEVPYETLRIRSNVLLEAWLMKTEISKGTVLIFHGYGGEKSSMLDKADVFMDLGYHVVLVDFMGSGGSEGNRTTIGYKEAREVRDVYRHVQGLGHRNIVLFGTSMGAVAIMKAISDYQL